MGEDSSARNSYWWMTFSIYWQPEQKSSAQVRLLFKTLIEQNYPHSDDQSIWATNPYIQGLSSIRSPEAHCLLSFQEGEKSREWGWLAPAHVLYKSHCRIVFITALSRVLAIALWILCYPVYKRRRLLIPVVWKRCLGIFLEMVRSWNFLYTTPSTLRRGNLKTAFSFLKRIKCFRSTLLKPEKFENASITGYFGFVFGENSVREVT